MRTKAQRTAGVWGAGGQQIMSITYAPSQPSTVYFGTDVSRIWKSTDGGMSWAPRSRGIGSHGVNSIAVHPRRPEWVLVAGGINGNLGSINPQWGTDTGIWRTTDGGETWAKVLDAPVASWSQKHLLTFVDDATAFFGSHGDGLWNSTDAGLTWRRVNLAELNGDVLGPLLVDPDDASQLFVASRTDAKLYRVRNGATAPSVAQVGAGLPAGIIYGLAARGNRDGNSSNDTLFVAVGTQGVYRSTDGGATFTQRNGVAPSQLRTGTEAWQFLARVSQSAGCNR